MLQKLKTKLLKLRNKYFRKSFVINFSFFDINESKIFSNKECFEEFLKMFKNDYVERLGNKDYIGAEVVKDIIERLIAMYSDFYADEKQEDKTKTIDIISQLQEKLKQEGDKLDK